jgi:hypothetical protein
MISQQSLVRVLLVTVLASAAFAEKKGSSSHPRPAPRIAGRFIDSDSARGLIELHYMSNSHPERFIGFIQSTCMLPPRSSLGESKPLDLSTIPVGTGMTVFYVPQVQGKQSVNRILALRFDRVQSGSALPVGVNISCFKAADVPASK